MFQLWTMYCESIAAMYNSTSENYVAASSTVMDFWARVTPGILQLLSHSKVVCEGWVPVQDGGSLSVRNSYLGLDFGPRWWELECSKFILGGWILVQDGGRRSVQNSHCQLSKGLSLLKFHLGL